MDFFLEFMDEESIRLYFSGSKGFHIELEPLAIGVSPSNGLSKIFRRIATTLKEDLELETVDFSVYDERRMWRMPYTIHQKTDLWKTEIKRGNLDLSVEQLKKYVTHMGGVPFAIPEQKLNPKAAQWYRKFVYQIEKEEHQNDLPMHERLKLLNKKGSRIVHSFNQDDMDFDPLRGLDGCPSILRLWKKAEETHDLDHEERLFLCSLLTYNQEAINYLYSILENCSDFDYNRSRHHIEDWIARREAGIGGRPYTCKTANEKGVGCGNCDLEPKVKYATVGGAIVETGEMAEPSPIRLLYKRKR
jgi:hypothetical protein